ncbi:hypothetical protein QBC46DRAFT_374363 [Diplogelasinospora grovesii]|uniref:Uncharacterized protein n=1 Tax=Diplogelasinospora grovesii TaxID=303347 RepID=A0AAN6NG21_9PEZI|nr:hypothetical protein QBC46DRAFT_374363 [Diplogelasinospora grovesii]
MYRTNNSSWKLTHILCILAHLGLTVGASIAYVYNMGKGMDSAVNWRQLSASGLNPCAFVLLAGRFGPSSEPVDMAIHTLPMSCLTMGILGLIINIGLFYALLAVDITKVTLTEGEQHWRKQIVTLFGCASNLILAGAGVGLASAMGTKISSSRALLVPLTWASIQAPLALVTALYDAIKNHREGQYLLD